MHLDYGSSEFRFQGLAGDMGSPTNSGAKSSAAAFGNKSLGV